MVGSVGGIKTSSSYKESTTCEVNTKLMWDNKTGIAGGGKLGSANAGTEVTEVGGILKEKADSGG